MKKNKIGWTRRAASLLFVVGILLCMALFAVPAFAADDTVFTKAENLLGDTQATILKISTPAALIGVGTGAAFKKFSMGDHQKIKTGNTVLWASLGGWATVNGLPLILNTIQQYIS